MGYFLSAYKQRGKWACKIYDGLMKPVCEIDVGCKTAAGCLGHAREWVENRVRAITNKHRCEHGVHLNTVCEMCDYDEADKAVDREG